MAYPWWRPDWSQVDLCISKELDIGFAFVATSDNATAWLGHRLLSQFQLYLEDSGKAELMEKSRMESFPKRASFLLKHNLDKSAKRNADPGWGGWKWKPTKDELSKYCGEYFADPSFGQRFKATVYLEKSELRINLGEYKLSLKPARPDLFAATDIPDGYAIALRFYTKKDGAQPYFVTWNRGRGLLFRLRRIDSKK